MSTYDPTWESLATHEIPGWLEDAPLGVYFHWGPYSVAGNGDGWYPRNMYREGSDTYEFHRERFGDPEAFGYKDLIPLFEGEAFDADAIAELCADAGADVVGLAAIHHDGFAMWDSDVTEWNAADRGPERDVVGELASAVRERDMKFLTTFHHAFTWWYYPREPGYDTMDPAYADLYGPPHEQRDRYPRDSETPPASYFEWWRDLTLEVVEDYRPDLLWFDFGWGNDAFLEHDHYRREVVAEYYGAAEEWGRDVEVCHKEHLPVGVGIVDHERTREEERSTVRWMTDTSVDASSWVYDRDPDYKSVATLVRGLVDRVSKNGTTLLNLCPRADGAIPDAQRERLSALGDWLATNEAAVAGVRPCWTFGEGPTDVTAGEFEEASRVDFTPDDVRFTRSPAGDVGYATLMGWPDGEATVETPVGRAISAGADQWAEPVDVRLLGADDDAVAATVGPDGLEVAFPESPPAACDHAYALRIERESGAGAGAERL